MHLQASKDGLEFNLLLFECMLLPKDGLEKADHAVIQVRGAERDHAL